MGYILTPTQTENDNKLINNALESLKTTNLLKQAKDTTTNPNLSTQNTQTTQSLQLPPKLPQGKIPQNIADSTKNTQNPQHSNTQKNIGFDSNVLSTQNTAKPLPQNDISTNSTQKPFNTQIALSSDKDFKPQSEMPQQTQIPQIQTPPKKSRLQREIESTKYATNFNQSAYTRNTTAFLGKPHEFSNHKLAMAAKLRLLENFDNNANIDDEVFQRYNIIDNAVAALETAKKIHGENSKAYKDILDQYMQYGILKDNGIKDYASLAEFYNKGGNVGIKTEFKGSENKESGLDSVNDKESKNTGKYKSIAEYNLTHMQMVNDAKRKDKSILDGTTDWALHGKYDTGSQVNSREQYEKGIHAGTSLDLLGNREMLDKQIAQNAEKNKDSLENYTKALAEFEKPNYFDETMKEFDKAWDKANMNTDTLRAMALFAKAYTWDSAADSLEGIYDWATTRFGDNKTETKLRDINLLDQKNNASMQVVGRGAEADELVRMFRITEGQLAVSQEAFKIYRHETKEALLDYIKADSKDKDKKWETYQKSLSKVKEAYDKSPAKAFANNELISKAMTMKNQHDYGRFVFNLFKNPDENRELAQQYINDLADILRLDDNFKDIDEVAITKKGEVVVKRGDLYELVGGEGALESILHGMHDSLNEITAGILTGMATFGRTYQKTKNPTAALGAGIVGTAFGSAGGAIVDEHVNAIKTGFINKDYGLKRANEALLLSAVADVTLLGAGKAIKTIKNANLDGLSNIGNKAISETQKLANGNVNAVTNFLAKNALDNNEREAIKEAAQKEFLNGKSLADYKSDSSIPKLERLKNAWQYEKFINKESMAKGKDKLEALSKEFESFQTTSMESNRPIMSLMQDMFEGKATFVMRCLADTFKGFFAKVCGHYQLGNSLDFC